MHNNNTAPYNQDQQKSGRKLRTILICWAVLFLSAMLGISAIAIFSVVGIYNSYRKTDPDAPAFESLIRDAFSDRIRIDADSVPALTMEQLMQLDSDGTIDIIWADADHSRIDSIQGKLTGTPVTTPEKAMEVICSLRNILGIADPPAELEPLEPRNTGYGHWLGFRQLYQGMEIVSDNNLTTTDSGCPISGIAVQTGTDNYIDVIETHYTMCSNVSAEPSVTEAEARSAAEQSLGRKINTVPAELCIYAKGCEPVLAYTFWSGSRNAAKTDPLTLVFVSAQNGTALSRLVYNSGHTDWTDF